MMIAPAQHASVGRRLLSTAVDCPELWLLTLTSPRCVEGPVGASPPALKCVWANAKLPWLPWVLQLFLAHLRQRRGDGDALILILE
jgi:hypothetical protein